MKKRILFLIILISGLFLGFHFVQALYFFDDPFGLFVWPICQPPLECYRRPPYEVCVNTYAVGVGACGFPGCDGGDTWSKYTFTNRCILVDDWFCDWAFVREETWASIADKLQPYCPSCGFSKKGYLAAGLCEGWESGGFYKVCCTSDGKVGNSGPYFIQDSYDPPTEGVCTFGTAEIVVDNFDISPNPGEPHPACIGYAPPQQPPPPTAPSSPPPTIVITQTCNLQGVFSSSPSNGNLKDRFNITYGVSANGTCDTCSGTIKVDLNLDRIQKRWGGVKHQSFQKSFTRGVQNITGSITDSTLFEAEYHGDQIFRVDPSGSTISCRDIEQRTTTSTTIIKINLQYIPITGTIFVRPTDVISLRPEVTSTPSHPSPGTYKTPLRNYIAGFEHRITYGIKLRSPFVFKKDDGNAFVTITGPNTSSTSTFPLQYIHTNPRFNDTTKTVIETFNFTPMFAGQYQIKSCHNADDEISQGPNDECEGRNILVYRYLCYQGFCWECPREPSLRGIYLDVRGAGCKVVEDIKCQTYINKSCRAGVRE